MRIKLIAIGNILMGDDGIALYAAAKLSERLEYMGIEAVAGETDIDFCVSAAADADIIFIADSSCMGEEAGIVRLVPLEALDASAVICPSQHDLSLLSLMRLLRYYSNAKSIFVVSIEIESIQVQPHLSDKMKGKLDNICDRLYYIIQESVKL